MSDTARLDHFTSAKKFNNAKPLYSDFFTNFNKHPDTGALVRLTDADAVKRSLRNLLMTNRGERLYRPDLGSDIRRALFEPMTPQMTTQIKMYIKDAIEKYEPRAKLVDIIVYPEEEHNTYYVTINFEIINSNNVQTLNISLVRIR